MAAPAKVVRQGIGSHCPAWGVASPRPFVTGHTTNQCGKVIGEFVSFQNPLPVLSAACCLYNNRRKLDNQPQETSQDLRLIV
jgi:hypothetical protein